MQAQAVYLAFVLGRLHVIRGLGVGRFRPEVHAPETEKSEVVGASHMLPGKYAGG